MIRAGVDEVIFTEPSHNALFIVKVDRSDYADSNECLFYMHFNMQCSPLLLVEREENNEDMVLMRTMYQRPRFSVEDCHYKVTLGYYKFQTLDNPTPLPKQSTIAFGFSSSPMQNLKSERMATLPTILESPERKIHYLSLDSE